MSDVKRYLKYACIVILFTILALGAFAIRDVQKSNTVLNRAPKAPTDLKIQLLEEAYGINTNNPAFSWVVHDEDNNEIQTEYRMFFYDSKKSLDSNTYLYDTKWIVSEESSNVYVKELQSLLKDNELYYVQVQTKDSKGQESPLSKAVRFTTEVGNEWISTQGIWGAEKLSEGPFKEKGWTNYSVLQDVTITKSGCSFNFRLKDSDNGISWHMDAIKNCMTLSYYQSGEEIKVKNVELSDLGMSITLNQMFKFKVVLGDDSMETFIDFTGTGNTYTKVDSSKIADTGSYSYGTIGYMTLDEESAIVDNLTVSKSDGTTLYATDFSDNISYFGNCTIVNGFLNVMSKVDREDGKFSGYYSEEQDEKANFVFFRSNLIRLNTEKIDKVILSATARNTEESKSQVFDLYVNGTSVGTGPAREYKVTDDTESNKAVVNQFYNTYDVTEEIIEGDNVFSAIANCNDRTTRSFLAQVTVFYKDRTKEVITNSSDGKWKTYDGTKAYGDNSTRIGTNYFYMSPENLNSKYYPFGWTSLDFDDSSWSTPVSTGEMVDGSSRVLVPYTSENTQRYRVDENTKTIKKLSDGSIVIDLGKEIVGGLQISLQDSVEETITVYYGEELNSDGSVKHQLAAGPDYTEHWTLIKGLQEFETVTMKNFRYIQLVGYSGKITAQDVSGWAMRQEFEEAESSFQSNSQILNEIYDFTKYSIEATNQDLYTDSQVRERAPYEGDLLINAASSYAFSDKYSLARYSGEYLINNETWPEDYKLYSIEVAWKDYLYTGNKESLQENYEKLKEKLLRGEDGSDTYVESVGLVTGNGLVDWPTEERDGFVESEYNTPYNAIFSGAYLYMAKIADLLGYTEDAKLYESRGEKIKNTLLTKLYNEDEGYFYDGMDANGQVVQHASIHASAYALAYGIYDQDSKDNLIQFVSNHGRFKGSIYMSYFILSGLYSAEGGAEATDLLLNDDYTNQRSFYSVLHSLKATISPEAWSLESKANLTLSHPWGTSPASQFVEGIFGIQPLDAGFKSFIIKFQMGTLEKAEIKIPTIKGSIEAAFSENTSSGYQGTRFTYSIPVNTQAKINIPISDLITTIVIDGESINIQDTKKMKLKNIIKKESYLEYWSGSGNHTVRLY